MSDSGMMYGKYSILFVVFLPRKQLTAGRLAVLKIKFMTSN